MYVESPARAGFGTTLIERSMKSLEGGEAVMRVESHGISWKLQMVLPDLAPVRKPASAPHRLSMSDDRNVAGAGGQRVLVVEDEPLLAMEMAATLGDAGFDVVGPASRIDEAMRLIAKAEFDGALLDANLAGRPVDELAAALTRRNIPFAFVTGYGRESLPIAFASAPLLAKPVDTAAVVRVARGLFSTGENAIPIRRDEPR